MYSGQGSHYYHMGKELFEKNRLFREGMLSADRVYQRLAKESLLDYLYSDKTSKGMPFTQTTYSHPAIFLLECGLTHLLRELDIVPDMVLGTSLGEFAAAVTAGCLDFETALNMVLNQASVLEHCDSGNMIAILADHSLYHTQPYLYNQSELASVNFSSHFVISCSSQNLSSIEAELKSRQLIYQVLPIAQAFHSSYIDKAEIQFKERIQHIHLAQPKIPLLSCVYGKEVATLQPEHFWLAAREMIRFQETINYLENKLTAPVYVDVGPSGTLATFVKYNRSPLSKSKSVELLTPYGRDCETLGKALKELKV
nr:acyltransferase domain-containing protein [Legionella maioricensis]